MGVGLDAYVRMRSVNVVLGTAKPYTLGVWTDAERIASLNITCSLDSFMERMNSFKCEIESCALVHSTLSPDLAPMTHGNPPYRGQAYSTPFVHFA